MRDLSFGGVYVLVRGICVEKSDVEVGHFEGRNATKVVSCVETRK